MNSGFYNASRFPIVGRILISEIRQGETGYSSIRLQHVWIRSLQNCFSFKQFAPGDDGGFRSRNDECESRMLTRIILPHGDRANIVVDFEARIIAGV